MFDYYHRWLAIPRDHRPPTYYQLLGIDPDETDPEVIEEAALRQASHVRTYQTGPHAQQCQDLLNEIGQAKVTLLHPDKRKDYDARLGALAANLPSQSPKAMAPDLQSSETECESNRLDFDFLQASANSSRNGRAYPASFGERSGVRPAALLYFALLLLGAGLAFWLSFTTP